MHVSFTIHVVRRSVVRIHHVQLISAPVALISTVEIARWTIHITVRRASTHHHIAITTSERHVTLSSTHWHVEFSSSDGRTIAVIAGIGHSSSYSTTSTRYTTVAWHGREPVFARLDILDI
jgi:hypothetical protein